MSRCAQLDMPAMALLDRNGLYGAPRFHTVMARAVHVKIRGTVKECRDPKDDMFLECAALAKAALIVAGDKDLLTLGSYKETRIVTPAEYLKAE
jgi:predicted nucleic acid-binding protein